MAMDINLLGILGASSDKYASRSGALSKENSTIGIVLTIGLIGLGIYIGVKHYKEKGFWWGIVALLLIGSYVIIGKDKNENL